MNLITEKKSKKISSKDGIWVSFEYKNKTYYYKFMFKKSAVNVKNFYKHNKDAYSKAAAGDLRIIEKRIKMLKNSNEKIMFSRGWIVTTLNPEEAGEAPIEVGQQTKVPNGDYKLTTAKYLNA